ncbi:MAG: hypothetical protein ACHQF4_02240 [Sphingobacteriales bacterium]
MGSGRFTKYFIVIFFLLSAAIVSCQKDQEIKDDAAGKSDTTFTAPDNYLATKGTLTVILQDSTYSFDAATDSIAFVNVHNDNNQYFGITAINKAHNMSFGISSGGYALSNINTTVAGSQFILKPDKGAIDQYALTDSASVQDYGKINLSTYKQDSVLAKGTFYTYLVKTGLGKPVTYKVKGTFSLRLK